MPRIGGCPELAADILCAATAPSQPGSLPALKTDRHFPMISEGVDPNPVQPESWVYSLSPQEVPDNVMEDARALPSNHAAKLVPLVEASVAAIPKALGAVSPIPVSFAVRKGFLLDRDESEALKAPDGPVLLLDVGGDLRGTIGFLCPFPIAASLASVQLNQPVEALAERAAAPPLNPDEETALEAIGGYLAGGIAEALGEISLHTLTVEFGSLRQGGDWDPAAAFEDTLLVGIDAECEVGEQGEQGEQVRGEVRVVLPRALIQELIGIDVGASERPLATVLPMMPEGMPPMALLGVALGPDQEPAVRSLADAFGLKLIVVGDIRAMLGHVVNHNIACAVIGCRGEGVGHKEAHINVATLKRLRLHPKGRDLSILCFIEAPEREHILEIGQLGVRDVIAVPAAPETLANRVKRFVETALAESLRKVA